MGIDISRRFVEGFELANVALFQVPMYKNENEQTYEAPHNTNCF